VEFVPYIFAAITILVGLKTIFTREATLNIKLWGTASDDPPHKTEAGYATSHHTGFIAVLIGIGEIAIGVGILTKAPALLS